MFKNLCYHTHNFFCDGKNSIDEMVYSAVLSGVKHIGISSHAPLKIPNKWSISYQQLNNYIVEIENSANKFAGKIEVFKSLEIDYIPKYTYSFNHFIKLLNLDYTIGSIHLVLNNNNNKLWFIDGDKKDCQNNFKTIFNSNIKEAITSYYNQIREMVITQKPDIIGHLDKVVMNTAGTFFDENEKWYIEEVYKTLIVIKENNAIIEINTRGLYKNKWTTSFPSPNILKMSNKLNIPIVISSDAHNITELTLSYDKAKKIALESGYKYQMIFIKGKWQKTKLN